MADWEPKIVAFLCNWCSYGAADLAGPADVLAAFQVLEHISDPFVELISGVKLL